jgi:hypothetical protein
MKRKNYKQESPEPKDYVMSHYSDDRSPSSWAATGRDDNNLFYWEEVPKEPTPDGPNGAVIMTMAARQRQRLRLQRRQPIQDAPVMLCDMLSIHIGPLRVGHLGVLILSNDHVLNLDIFYF